MQLLWLNITGSTYWVVRKVRADFEGKLKRRRFKFLISFIKFKSFTARTFRTTQYVASMLLQYRSKSLSLKTVFVYYYQLSMQYNIYITGTIDFQYSLLLVVNWQ